MPVSFDRNSRVLLALVVSMTLGAGLLLMLAPDPSSPVPSYESLTGPVDQRTMPSYLKADRPAIAWRQVVIHRDRMPDSRVDNYHFVVETGGHIQATALWLRQGASRSAGRLDESGPGIHVAVVGDVREQAPPDVQLNKLRELVEQLVRHIGIAPERVKLHSDLEPVECPGRAFERAWREIMVF